MPYPFLKNRSDTYPVSTVSTVGSCNLYQFTLCKARPWDTKFWTGIWDTRIFQPHAVQFSSTIFGIIMKQNFNFTLIAWLSQSVHSHLILSGFFQNSRTSCAVYLSILWCLVWSPRFFENFHPRNCSHFRSVFAYKTLFVP